MSDADVLVVGAGSSGAVVARRLVDAGLDVVLVEAGGPDDDPAVHDPQQVLGLLGGPRDWAYETVPQEHLHDRRIAWPRGKGLGGSSAINGMIYVRGSAADYDHWAYLGNPGWRYQDVLPLFRRSERFDGPADGYHGTDGLWAVRSRYRPSPIHEAFVAAAVAAGVPANPDYNGASSDGAALVQFSVDGTERATTAQAFLRGVAAAPNLDVRTGTRVARLLFDGTRCTGAEVVGPDGRATTISVRHEVVVSAGAVESPRILTLSGIAGADELDRLRIPRLVDAPGVGRNLSDHLLAPFVHTLAREPEPAEAGIPPMGSQLFWRSRAGLPAPDLQPLVFSAPLYSHDQTGPSVGLTISPGIVRPASRGTIRLRSADLDDELLIDPRYCSAPADLEALVDAAELCRRIAAQPPLAEDWGAHELFPGPAVDDREGLREYIREHVGSYWHPVGTCAMGTSVDAVVDPELRVIGVQGLRVADASIMPTVPSGNTAAPSVMVGERASDLVAAALGVSLRI